jgi:hypothetical protein
MATLCRTYSSEAVARRAIDDLRAAGLPPQGARLIVGGPVHDRRREPMGEFARAVGPDAPVGTFGDVTLERWRPGGTFAGDADRRRQGSFADVDRNLVVTRDPGQGEHRHVASRHDVETLLRATGVELDEAARVVAELCDGRSLVLVQITEMSPDDAAKRLEAAEPVA